MMMGKGLIREYFFQYGTVLQGVVLLLHCLCRLFSRQHRFTPGSRVSAHLITTGKWIGKVRMVSYPGCIPVFM